MRHVAVDVDGTQTPQRYVPGSGEE